MWWMVDLLACFVIHSWFVPHSVLTKIISTQISEQKILMWFLSHNIPKRNKLAEKISQKNPEYISSPLKPLNQIKANLAGMVLGWSPFNIVSDSPALHSKWLLLLKIEISLVVNFHFNSNFWAKDFDVIFIS
jgi:hypothetical protein